jgi:hypothetical protein
MTQTWLRLYRQCANNAQGDDCWAEQHFGDHLQELEQIVDERKLGYSKIQEWEQHLQFLQNSPIIVHNALTLTAETPIIEDQPPAS